MTQSKKDMPSFAAQIRPDSPAMLCSSSNDENWPVRDVGARISRLNRELAEAHHELMNESLEVKRIRHEHIDLLGIAAHDLRHPIGAILIYSELLAEEADSILNNEQKELLNSIHSLSEFMLRLLRDTLEISAAQSGRVSISAKPSDILAIVEESVSLSRPLAARKQMQLNVRQDENIPPVNVDALKVTQVFNNLIENAIKHCQNGAKIEVGISLDDDRILVSVRDDGPGIPPDDLKDLFTPFHRTRAQALSAEPGTGLGLAIAKRIVEYHDGGRIWVESRLGTGTTFYVSLPASIDRGNPEGMMKRAAI
jgi:two-component system sensor histidine kinase/response regulator